MRTGQEEVIVIIDIPTWLNSTLGNCFIYFANIHIPIHFTQLTSKKLQSQFGHRI